MSEFKDSIAQANVNYPIETVIEPIAGENYSRAMIFVKDTDAAAYLPGLVSVTPGSLIELNSNNYGSITGGLLKTWLDPFFAKATTSKVGIAIYDEDSGEPVTPATAPLSEVYAAKKMYAYFKFGIASSGYDDLQVALSNLCKADPLYSVLWIGTNDSAILTSNSSLMSALVTAESTARVVYNSNENINGALAQLGATLSSANATGTPVGNSCDMLQFNTISASGAADAEGNHANLTATQKAALDTQKVGYQTWVGDGTENVVTEGSLYLNGDSVGANWVKAYIEYRAKVRTANYMTRMNVFRNNQSYQAILLILTDEVRPFLNFGRLANFVLTAPVFEDLPTSGDQITVPNAWQADYVDNIRQVTVYGTLYITQPTR